MNLEWSNDGCPNDCGYCKDTGMNCIYSEEGKVVVCNCALCEKPLSNSEIYDYRGFNFCEDCLDDGKIAVENKRNQYMKMEYHTTKDASELKKEYDAGIL